MATVPKTSPPLNLASVTKIRLGPPTRVVSQGQSSVEELQSSANVSFDSAAYGFREEDRSTFNHQGGNRQPHHQPGVVNAPTQAFAAMLEGGEASTSGKSDGRDVNAPRFSALISKAIEIYETNARVVSGENYVLGTSVSLVL
ncbi:MAG: hypothetical protein IH994_03755 [Proteobacteria bacterium]|nr:hypothetical protein [Pseudomonadota bacterium]